jgi:hypothetical protein
MGTNSRAKRTGVAMIAMRWFLLVPCCLASAQHSWGQDVVTLLERNEFDWSAWEIDVGDKRALLDRFLGDCPNLGSRSDLGPVEGNFHFLDFSGDGVADLVYSGEIWYCDEGYFEGMMTRLYQSRNGKLAEIASSIGHITGAWRAGPWEPITFLVREDGCCGAEWAVYHFLHPARAPDGSMTYTAGNYVYSQGYVELPEVRFDLPRPFSVQQNEYNLRSSPEIPEYQDNILAVYGIRATGIAVGEATGPDGRVWWFVVMDAPYRPLRVRDDSYETYVGQRGLPGSGGRYVGWMSSRYLYALPQTPDTLASPEDWFRYRD